MVKLAESTLRGIIKEELKRVLEAHDDMDYGQAKDGRSEAPHDAAAKNKKQYHDFKKQYNQEVKDGKTKLSWEKWHKKAKFKAFTDKNPLPTDFPSDDRENTYGQKALNEEESVTFTVKEHVRSHFGTAGIVKTVGTYDSFEEAEKVAKQGNRYIVSSKGKQFYPNSSL